MRKIETLFGDKDSAKDVYNSFATQVSNRKEKPSFGKDPNLVNPAELEAHKVDSETDPSANENETH
jgi:hypothetical protein